MSDSLPFVLASIASQPWAIERGFALRCLAVLSRRLSHTDLSSEDLDAEYAASNQALFGRAAGPSPAAAASNIAVLPLYGLLKQRFSNIEASSGGGGTSTNAFGKAFEAAVASPDVAHIVIDVASGGGECHNCSVLHNQIRAARSRKNVVAIANSMCCSAALWIASAATSISAAPGADIGSIGVISLHEDLSRQLDKLGITVSTLATPAWKGELSPFAPLSPGAKSALMDRIHEVYGQFTRDVAMARGASITDVRGETWGMGRTLGSGAALKAGMIDRIESFDQLMRRLGAGQSAPARQRATTDRPSLAATTGGMDLETRRRRMAFIARRGA